MNLISIHNRKLLKKLLNPQSSPTKRILKNKSSMEVNKKNLMEKDSKRMLGLKVLISQEVKNRE